jgi:hypothetical protein
MQLLGDETPCGGRLRQVITDDLGGDFEGGCESVAHVLALLLELIGDRDVRYKHRAGLYYAAVYEDASSFMRKESALLEWRCNRLLKEDQITKELDAYTLIAWGDNELVIDGVSHKIDNPRDGRIIEVPRKKTMEFA